MVTVIEGIPHIYFGNGDMILEGGTIKKFPGAIALQIYNAEKIRKVGDHAPEFDSTDLNPNAALVFQTIDDLNNFIDGLNVLKFSAKEAMAGEQSMASKQMKLIRELQAEIKALKQKNEDPIEEM